MISLIIITTVIFVILTYAIFKLLKRDKTLIKEKFSCDTEGRESKNIKETTNIEVEDNVEKDKEIEQIKLENENRNKFIVSRPTCIAQTEESDREEHFKNEENLIHDGFDIAEEEEISPLSAQEINSVKETIFNPDDMLNRFVGYINRNKLAKIEDLSFRLKSCANETIDQLRDMEIQGNTMGFLDDKGIYMSLSERELDV